MRIKREVFLLVFGVAWLVGRPCLGQALPSYHYTPTVPPPHMPMNYGYSGATPNPAFREGAGSYQLPDGSWQSSQQLIFNGNKLVVQDAVAGKLKLTAEKVRQFEIKQDTFLVVNNLYGQMLGAKDVDFVQSQFNQKGVRLLVLYGDYGQPTAFLSRPGQPLLLLPNSKAGFKKTMLQVVKDYPVLATQVSDGSLGRADLLVLLQAYVERQRPAAVPGK